MKHTSVKNPPFGSVIGAKWRGVRCQARVCWVIVGEPPDVDWWSKDLVDQERLAVHVIPSEGEPFFLDYADGLALNRLTGASDELGLQLLPVQTLMAKTDGLHPIYCRANKTVTS